jgi:hypothetical protein
MPIETRRNRNRVLKLSSSYRNPMVKHEPELHMPIETKIETMPGLLRRPEGSA